MDSQITLSTSALNEFDIDDLMWGTYGKSGKEPLKWLKLRELETDHLQAIMHTQPQIYYRSHKNYHDAIVSLLEARGAEIPELDMEAFYELGRR